MAVELKGKAVAEVLREHIQSGVAKWKAQSIIPRMVTILVDGDPASLVYAEQKGRIANKLGIEYELKRFPANVTERQLIDAIHRFNKDANMHGIMIELPLPSHISTEAVTAEVAPEKDVDGLTRFNRLANLSGEAGIYPATPLACVRLLKHYGYSLSGKDVVLVGCGKTVGMPLMHLLLRENATVTVCHAGTKDLRAHLAKADIAFVAVGKADLITPDMVHPNLLIIDAGINETPDHKIVGDVSPEVANYVAAMSPTPGGVGTVTTMQLFANLLTAMENQVSVKELVTA